MIPLKKGQGVAMATPEPAQTPERKTLTLAIEKLEERREYLARAERALAANSFEARIHLHNQQDQAEETLRKLPQLMKDYVRDLAYGEATEKPPAERDLRDVIERCEREIADAKNLEKAHGESVEDLQARVQWAERELQDAAHDALRTDPVAAALVEECQAAHRKFQYLNRAVLQFAKSHADLVADRYLKQIGFKDPIPPCPYAEAREALRHSADAPVPTLEEALSRL